MPALAQALAGALPDGAVRQLMQALGNCQQPLTHRGAVNFQPPGRPTQGGLARPGAWSPSDYRNLLPTAGSESYVDVPGQGGGPGAVNNSHNYDGNQFYFPTDLGFEYTDYYGGDTFNVTGPSNFDNSTHSTVNAGDVNTNSISVNYINNTYVGGDGIDGRPGPAGRDGFNGFNGFNGLNVFGVLGGFPGAGGLPATTIYVRDVTAKGKVTIPTVDVARVKDDAVDITQKLVPKNLSVTGQVTFPTIDAAEVPEFVGTGTVTLQTVTGGTLAGATAGGQITYDIYPTATCGPLTATVPIPTGGSLSGATASGSVPYTNYPTATCGAITGTVSVPITATLSASKATGTIAYDSYPTATCGAITGTVPLSTGGTFSANPTGIAVAATVGSLSGTVTIPMPTGGYLDAACKLVLTTTNQTYSVTFTGAPGVTVSSQGSVSGNVSLTGSAQQSLVVYTPVITLTKAAANATASLPVTGTVTLGGTTSLAVTVSTPSITMTSAATTALASLVVNGGTVSLTGATTTSVTVSTPSVTMTSATTVATASLTVTGGTVTPTTGSTSVAVTVTCKTVGVVLTYGSMPITVASTGSLTVNDPEVGKLRNTTVQVTAGTTTVSGASVKIKAITKPAVLIYLRPG